MQRRVWAAAVIGLASVAQASEPPRYVMQVIGGLEAPASSGLVSFPLGLGSDGRVVGYASTSSSPMQVMDWHSGEPSWFAPIQGASRSYGSKANAWGQVVGAAMTTDANGATLQTRAMRWNGPTGQSLGSLGGLHSAALGINDFGRIVGYSTLAGESQVRAFEWAGGVMSELRVPGGATQSYAYDISNQGHIVGAYAGTRPARPIMWRDGVMYQLAIPDSSRTGTATAVNDSGLIVGNYEINQAYGTFAAVAWNQYFDRINLGNLGGSFPYAVANDVNNLGQIVGTSNSPGGYTGFLWMNGQMVDLRSRLLPGSPGSQIVSAHGINDLGQIAAAALIDGRITAVLLTPVTASTPAPGSVALVVWAGLVAGRRRRG